MIEVYWLKSMFSSLGFISEMNVLQAAPRAYTRTLVTIFSALNGKRKNYSGLFGVEQS